MLRSTLFCAVLSLGAGMLAACGDANSSGPAGSLPGTDAESDADDPSEASTADAPTESAADAEVDSTPDSGPDSQTDAGPDAEPDGGSDVQADGPCNPGVPVGDTYCNVDADLAQHDECGDEMLVQDCVAASDHGACLGTACGCEPGYAGDTCDSCVVYVDAFLGNDANEGRTWGLAKQSVQAGIDAAATLTVTLGDVAACEVWVKAGEYLPNDTAGRASTITLRKDIAVYGGFAGGESLRSQRDIAQNGTTLSGDLGVADDATDNSYHVVTGADGAVLDGFTVTEGNANNDQQALGGGMLNVGVSPIVRNCTFTLNAASSSSAPTAGGGGGMASIDGAAPQVSHCTFTSNTASGFGGGMLFMNATATVSDCQFLQNAALSPTSGAGGGVMIWGQAPITTLERCTFRQNSAANGAGVAVFQSEAEVRSCVFEENATTDAQFGTGGGLAAADSSTRVVNSVFRGNSAAVGGGLACTGMSTTMSTSVVNCTFTANQANGSSGGGGALFSMVLGTTVKNSIMWGDGATGGPAEIGPQGEVVSVTHSLVAGGYAGVGNIDASPEFLSPTDLRIQAYSPAVDAADGCAAPSRDLDDNRRFDLAGAANKCIGPAVDIGAHEFQGGAQDTDVTAWVDACCELEAGIGPELHDYLSCTKPTTHADAQAFCSTQGMRLAVIPSLEESDAVTQAALSRGVFDQYFIGATDIDVEGTWAWIDGTPWSYAHWSAGNPSDSNGSEDCGSLLVYTPSDPNSGYWNDISCDALLPYVCERN